MKLPQTGGCQCGAIRYEITEAPQLVSVHVHCIANYRVSAFFYRYNRDVLGMDEAQASAEMEAVWHPEGVWAAFIA